MRYTVGDYIAIEGNIAIVTKIQTSTFGGTAGHWITFSGCYGSDKDYQFMPNSLYDKQCIIIGPVLTKLARILYL